MKYQGFFIWQNHGRMDVNRRSRICQGVKKRKKNGGDTDEFRYLERIYM